MFITFSNIYTNALKAFFLLKFNSTQSSTQLHPQFNSIRKRKTDRQTDNVQDSESKKKRNKNKNRAKHTQKDTRYVVPHDNSRKRTKTRKRKKRKEERRLIHEKGRGEGGKKQGIYKTRVSPSFSIYLSRRPISASHVQHLQLPNCRTRNSQFRCPLHGTRRHRFGKSHSPAHDDDGDEDDERAVRKGKGKRGKHEKITNVWIQTGRVYITTARFPATQHKNKSRKEEDGWGSTSSKYCCCACMHACMCKKKRILQWWMGEKKAKTTTQ